MKEKTRKPRERKALDGNGEIAIWVVFFFVADVLIGHRDVHLNLTEFTAQNRECGSWKHSPH